MIRERTRVNLAIGFILSLSLHTYLVIWGPPLSLPVPALQQPTELEVYVREWPAAPTVPPAEDLVTSAEPPPAPPPPPRQAQPAIPPDAVVLQEAMRAATTPIRLDQAAVRLPEQPLPMPPSTPEDPVRAAEALMESLRTEPPALTSSPSPSLPEPERHVAERRELPPLPALEHAPRRAPAPVRPATMTMPPVDRALPIKGPAAERQVIFRPPPPSVTVETEAEFELRFWILPNGTVSRIVPLKKSDPRLEALATNYLRHWRFSPLPPGLEQDEQWGIIPFKFRFR